MFKKLSLSFALIVLGLATAGGSTSATAQTSVGLSLYGAFNGTTNSNGVQQSPANSAGGLVELRHITNPLIGWEITYSYNRANEKYTPTTCPSGFSSCPSTSVSADAHEMTVDWNPSVHIANLRPFGVLGVGVLLNEPVGGQSSTMSSDKAVYVYGAGLDWGLLPHLGLRFQYRGNLYMAPDVSRLYTSSSAFAHTAEPMIGAYFNF